MILTAVRETPECADGGRRGVRPDGGPCGAGNADEPAPRPNPAGGNIHNYRQIPLAGKRIYDLDGCWVGA